MFADYRLVRHRQLRVLTGELSPDMASRTGAPQDQCRRTDRHPIYDDENSNEVTRTP